jgi:hypothetical protein
MLYLIKSFVVRGLKRPKYNKNQFTKVPSCEVEVEPTTFGNEKSEGFQAKMVGFDLFAHLKPILFLMEVQSKKGLSVEQRGCNVGTFFSIFALGFYLFRIPPNYKLRETI